MIGEGRETKAHDENAKSEISLILKMKTSQKDDSREEETKNLVEKKKEKKE